MVEENYSQVDLEDKVKNHAWAQVTYRPQMFDHPLTKIPNEVQWAKTYCANAVEYRDGVFYFENPKEATAFAMVWIK